jgi:15-cis-phytoene synthase
LAGDELEDVVRRADPDRWLASRLIGDPRQRADVLTLYAFDAELARAVRITSSPLMAEIRLTWWSEVLDEIAGEGPVRAHPLAQALGEVVHRRRLPIQLLREVVEGRIAALGMSQLDDATALAWADAVGGPAAVLAALILGAKDAASSARPAGCLIGLATLARGGAIDRAGFATRFGSMLNEANVSARRLPASAFPAVAAASLARDRLGDRAPSDLARGLRLVWAALRGRV